ncbi:MAG TPA: acyl-CoA desaturase [Polyangiaceae bacterium]|jgi:stearoyl-CoA desaturase (delta-9 desaturase)|nr:acyl-CoA desaturase [Polyangiaceae bacterium]
MAIALFFVAHWQLSVFCQTFFLHRYGAHRMFTMSKGWERFFHLLTYVTQGSSYLNPRGYAILHRMHHAFSDTPKDPHSPRNYPNAFRMMWVTKKSYDDFAYRRVEPEARFDGGMPDWPALDAIGKNWPMRMLWIAGYTAFYVKFATQAWMFALLPMHFVMGPIHGAIVNWCGHRYGYRNFDNGDDSVNSLPFDFVTLGELFQNNHHKFGMSPSFAARWFEIDPTYLVIRALDLVGIITLSSGQKMRYPERPASVPEVTADTALPEPGAE